MVAEKVFSYRGKALKKGDVFDVDDQTHQRQLRGAGLASDVKPTKKKEVEVAKPDTGPAKVADVEDAPKEPEPTVTSKKNTEYKARKLKAED